MIPNRPICAAAVRRGLPRPGDPIRLEVSENIKCDALIVGAGITGSLVAERLTRQGLNVVIVDRELPGRGSTAASTSMLLWEIDRSLDRIDARLMASSGRRAPIAPAWTRSPA